MRYSDGKKSNIDVKRVKKKKKNVEVGANRTIGENNTTIIIKFCTEFVNML